MLAVFQPGGSILPRTRIAGTKRKIRLPFRRGYPCYEKPIRGGARPTDDRHQPDYDRDAGQNVMARPDRAHRSRGLGSHRAALSLVPDVPEPPSLADRKPTVG